MSNKKYSLTGSLVSLLKCGAYFGVYYAINLALSVVWLAVMMIKNPEADQTELINSVAIPLTLLCNAIFLLVVAVFYDCMKVRRSFGERICASPLNLKAMPFILCLGVTAMFTVNLVIGLIPFPESWLKMLEENSDMITSSSMLMQVVCVGIVGPVAEEVLFRGLMLTALKKNMPSWIAIIISSVIFGIMHGNPIGIIYATAMGILMGWIFHRTGSILASCIFHIVYNTVSLFAGYISETALGLITVISLGIFIVCIIALAIIPPAKKNEESQNHNDEV